VKAMPFVVFFVCAAIAGYAAVGLFAPHDAGAAPFTPYRLLPEMLGFLVVFFGLASLSLPVVIAIMASNRADR
jgi:hypothetical protein